MNIPYNNRNQNNFFQPTNQPPQAFARALPMYSTTVTNSPVSMMNYFNAPTTQQLVSAEHENPYQVHQQKLQNLPIDLVSTRIFFASKMFYTKNFFVGFISNQIVKIELRRHHCFIGSSCRTQRRYWEAFSDFERKCNYRSSALVLWTYRAEVRASVKFRQLGNFQTAGTEFERYWNNSQSNSHCQNWSKGYQWWSFKQPSAATGDCSGQAEECYRETGKLLSLTWIFFDCTFYWILNH